MLGFALDSVGGIRSRQHKDVSLELGSGGTVRANRLRAGRHEQDISDRVGRGSLGRFVAFREQVGWRLFNWRGSGGASGTCAEACDNLKDLDCRPGFAPRPDLLPAAGAARFAERDRLAVQGLGLLTPALPVQERGEVVGRGGDVRVLLTVVGGRVVHEAPELVER